MFDHKSYSSSRSIAAFYFIISVALGIYLRADNAATDGFSAEIGNVAAAVATGQGFSGVFGPDTGTTAWCPLLYVLIYAAVFTIFGVKTVPAFWALMVLRSFLMASTLFLMMEINYSRKLDNYKILLLPIFIAYSFMVIYRTGPKDAMFVVFLSMLLLYAIQRVLESGFHRNRTLLYSMAIFLPFANISLSIGLFLFVLLVGFGLITPRSNSISLKHVILLNLVMLGCFSLWGLRNTSALGKFIPFKSNLWFELYISNVADDDGLLKYSNYRALHPMVNKSVRENYIAKGELLFLDRYQSESINYLKNNTINFIKKISNRFTNIFIYAESENDIELADVENFNNQDVNLLIENGLILDNYWICLEKTLPEIERLVSRLDLSGDKDIILDDWKKKAVVSGQRVSNTKNIKEFLEGVLTSLLPFLAILTCLMVPELRKNQLFIAALVLFLLSIGPYLIISWIPRYQSFQLGFFTVFVFMAFSTLVDYLQKKFNLELLG